MAPAIKVTLCNNFTLFEVWFYRRLVLVHPQIHFDSIWSCEGQINTCVFPTSHPGYALCSSVFPGGKRMQKWKKSFHTHDIASYTARVCLGKFLSVSTGLLVVFARFLHAF